MKIIDFIKLSLDEKSCRECSFSDECDKQAEMCFCDIAMNKLDELNIDLGEL